MKDYCAVKHTNCGSSVVGETLAQLGEADSEGDPWNLANDTAKSLELLLSWSLESIIELLERGGRTILLLMLLGVVDDRVLSKHLVPRNWRVDALDVRHCCK